MSDNLNQAVALLNDALALSRSTTSVVNQERLDAVVERVAVSALEEVEKFADELEARAEAAQDAVDEATLQISLKIMKEEERKAKAVVQEEEDQAQREERNRLGVS